MSDLTIERRYAADATTVYAHLTRPEHITDWFGPADRDRCELDMDFTRTVPWSALIVMVSGDRHRVSGEVTALDPPRSVEFTWAWHDENDARGRESRVRFDVAAAAEGGAHLTLTHSGLADDEIAGRHRAGWTGSLDRLDACFAAQASKGA